MRIAVLVKDFPPEAIGGTETQTRRMARELSRHGHEVTVYTKDYPDASPATAYDFDVVRVPNLRASPFVSTLSFVLFAFLYLLRDANRFDVVQCMMIYPNGFVGYLVSRLRGLPYFAWIRGGDYYFMKDTWWKRWQIRHVLADTLVLAQSPVIADDVRADFPSLEPELRVLGNGVDIPDETADGDEVLYVGRLASMKGVEVLVRAMGRVGTDRTCRIVGDGDERESLEALAAGVDADVRFEGYVDPECVGSYYRDAAVFVLPSTGEEGLPNAVLEAMAHGLPVVTTPSGGLPSLVEDGATGFLVQTGDVDSLAERVRLLLGDPDLRADVGSAARNYVRTHHSWDAIVERLEDVYAAVIARSGGTRRRS